MNRSVRPTNFFEKVNCAVEGVRNGIRTQLSLQLELAGAALLVGCAVWVPFNRESWLWLIAAIGLVISVELINSAIEHLCDLVQDRPDPRIKVIKDLSAGGVLMAMTASVSVAVLLFYPVVEPAWAGLVSAIRSLPDWIPVTVVLVMLLISLAGRGLSRLELRRGVPSMQGILAFGSATLAALATGQFLVALLVFFLAVLVVQSRIIARIISGWEALTGALIGTAAGLFLGRWL